MATDQHSVNVLLSKWTVSEQRRQEVEEAEAAGGEAEIDARFHIPTYCIQHKTGSAVERVSLFLGLISPAFCIASLLSWGNLADDLDALLLETIEEDLICSPDPPAMSASDARQVAFVRALLDECYVNDVQQDTDGDAEQMRLGVERRKAHARGILEFFWTLEWADGACLQGCLLSWGQTGLCPESLQLA